mmetsp:Transcript_15176/g.21290  ORF Transcript_15176/g.21290 Transcript_15176/m.21290 type:complete len:387 (-) Transcript_15176:863-2023(-)
MTKMNNFCFRISRKSKCKYSNLAIFKFLMKNKCSVKENIQQSSNFDEIYEIFLKSMTRSMINTTHLRSNKTFIKKIIEKSMLSLFFNTILSQIQYSLNQNLSNFLSLKIVNNKNLLHLSVIPKRRIYLKQLVKYRSKNSRRERNFQRLISVIVSKDEPDENYSDLYKSWNLLKINSNNYYHNYVPKSLLTSYHNIKSNPSLLYSQHFETSIKKATTKPSKQFFVTIAKTLYYLHDPATLTSTRRVCIPKKYCIYNYYYLILRLDKTCRENFMRYATKRKKEHYTNKIYHFHKTSMIFKDSLMLQKVSLYYLNYLSDYIFSSETAVFIGGSSTKYLSIFLFIQRIYNSSFFITFFNEDFSIVTECVRKMFITCNPEIINFNDTDYFE